MVEPVTYYLVKFVNDTYLFGAAPTPATAGAPLSVVRLGSRSRTTEGSGPE